MRRLALLSILAVLALPAAPADAQMRQDQQRVYNAYFKIDFADIDRWIENWQTYDVPLLEELEAEGLLDDFGLWAHHTGGEYNIRFNFVVDHWDKIGDYWDTYFARVNPESMGAAMGMIRKHTDVIWVVDDSDFPGENPSHVYEASWDIAFDQWEQWDANFEAVQKPVLQRAAAEGLLTGWAKTSHDTGGIWNRKLVYWLSSWDAWDDVYGMMMEAMEGQDPEMARMIKGHSDEIYAIVPRTPGM